MRVNDLAMEYGSVKSATDQLIVSRCSQANQVYRLYEQSDLGYASVDLSPSKRHLIDAERRASEYSAVTLYRLTTMVFRDFTLNTANHVNSRPLQAALLAYALPAIFSALGFVSLFLTLSVLISGNLENGDTLNLLITSGFCSFAFLLVGLTVGYVRTKYYDPWNTKKKISY